jgi:hypothetical protein
MSGSEPTGSTPNWPAGYVPPAAEWSHWWSVKLDAANPDYQGAPFISQAGGTMLGPLHLSGLPTAPDQAASKAYVDSITPAAGPFMPMTGGAFTGPVTTTSTITLAGNPSANLQAAPKQYVDAATTLGNTALTTAQAAVRRNGDTMTGALVLFGDPSATLQAATKQYADTKLALAGGTITGALTLNSGLQAKGSVHFDVGFNISPLNNYEWSIGTNSSGDHIETHRTGWYDQWVSASGTRNWVSGNAVALSLDTAGNLGVTGTVTMAAGAVSGGLNVTGALGLGAGTPWTFNTLSGGQRQTHAAGGYYDEWVIADGTRNWYAANVKQMALDPGGTLALEAGVSAGNGTMLMGAMAGGYGVQFAAGYYFFFDPNNGNLVFRRANTDFWIMRQSDLVCFNNQGPVGGVGAYINNSDERGKANITPATVGLAEVLALRPISFTRVNDGRNPDEIEIGFSAQQVASVIPEAVRPMGVSLRDGGGGIDTDTPTLGVSSDPIIAALVMGMQEMAAEIAALKAARA